MIMSTAAYVKVPVEHRSTNPQWDSAHPDAFGSQTISRLFDREIHSFASLLRNRFAFIVAIVLKRTRSENLWLFSSFKLFCQALILF